MFRFFSLLLAVVLGSSLLMLIAGPVVCADEPSDVEVVESGAGDLESKAEKLPWSRWDMRRLEKPPKYRWLDSQSIVRSMLYRGEDYQGHPTEVFAYYASPETLTGEKAPESRLPGIVLLHGGGGTAFSEWVEKWARRGYAAIAMDLGGKRPATPVFDATTGQVVQRFDHMREKRVRLESAGPWDDHAAKFQNINDDPTDDWQFHAVSAAIRAHSLLRSFPEVDPERTALTGISWGGYLTCLTASVDDRFKAAVPVYGCGYLHDGESVQRPMIDRLNDGQRDEWIRLHDPSSFLVACRVPMFFVNGTNDKHYPLKSYARSYKLVKGPLTLRIEAGMRHSHVHGWAPIEIGRFVDQHLLQAPALLELSKPVMQGDVVSATFPMQQKAVGATLQYTGDQGELVGRHWKRAKATLGNGKVSAKVPEDATIWCLAVTGSDGAMVTTEVMFREP